MNDTSEKKCPHPHALRPDLPPLPERFERIAALPVDERGYPVPFFVAWIEGKPEFRLADPEKMARCFKEHLCWVCGQPLGAYVTFPIGPMCAINRTTSEPGSHLDCAEWSVKACPFLAKPQMHRREDELTRANEGNVAGIMISRNPGVTCLWTTRYSKLFSDGRGGVLVEVGNPSSVSWWRQGRPATLLEVEESIQSGLPLLLEHCANDKERAMLQQQERALTPWLPTGELPL